MKSESKLKITAEGSPLSSPRPASRSGPAPAAVGSRFLARWGALAAVLGPALIVALGFALRLHAVAAESLWYDELLQLDIAAGPLDMIFPRLRGHSGVPLDYLLTHFWIKLGHSDGWVRLPAVVAGTLTLPVAYQLGRALLHRRAGLVLMALLALSPFHIRYSQEVRPYALVVLGVTLTGYGFWRLYQTGRWRYFAALQGGVLISWLAHIFATTLFLPLTLFAGLILILGRQKRRSLQALAALLLATGPPLLIFWAMGWSDVLFYTTREFSEAVIQPDKFAAVAAQPETTARGPEVTWSFVKTEMLQPLSIPFSRLGMWLFSGLALLGAFELLRRGQRGRLLLLAGWVLLPPVLIMALLIFRQTFFAPRYIILILPAYLLLVGMGLLSLTGPFNQKKRPGLALITLIGLGGVLAWLVAGELDRYYSQKDKEDWHLVADFIAQNADPADAVIAFRAEPTLNWYYTPAGAVPNYYHDLDDIEAAVAGAERSWVILSIFSSGADARVKAWLGEQQAVRFVLDPIIHVYYLGLDTPRERLLEEIQQFALPVDHALYASLARENRRRPEVARQYYRLTIAHAPTEEIRAEYRLALEAMR